MSHHGDGLTPEWMERIRHQARAVNAPVGATGRFPLGTLTPADKGELRIAIVNTPDGKVVMDFGAPTAWIGLTPAQALAIAATLRKHAKRASSNAG